MNKIRINLPIPEPPNSSHRALSPFSSRAEVTHAPPVTLGAGKGWERQPRLPVPSARLQEPDLKAETEGAGKIPGNAWDQLLPAGAAAAVRQGSGKGQGMFSSWDGLSEPVTQHIPSQPHSSFPFPTGWNIPDNPFPHSPLSVFRSCGRLPGWGFIPNSNPSFFPTHPCVSNGCWQWEQGDIQISRDFCRRNDPLVVFYTCSKRKVQKFPAAPSWVASQSQQC